MFQPFQLLTYFLHTYKLWTEDIFARTVFDGFALNSCCLQSGFPSQFYFALPCFYKLAELMQLFMGSCEIIPSPREKWDCLWMAYWGFSVCTGHCGLTQRRDKTFLSRQIVFRVQPAKVFHLQPSLPSFLPFLRARWAGIGRTTLRFREVPSKMRGITTTHKL